MSELDDLLRKIKSLIQVLEEATLPPGIVIEGSKNVSVLQNTLINCGISVKDSEEVTLFANKITNNERRLIIELLNELLDLLSREPHDKNKIMEILDRLKEVAEPIYVTIATFGALKTLIA